MMASIKEEIKAMCVGDFPAIIRVKRKENAGIPETKLEMVLRYVSKIASVTSFTVLVLNADTWKLIALGAMGIFALAIYSCMKD